MDNRYHLETGGEVDCSLQGLGREWDGQIPLVGTTRDRTRFYAVSRVEVEHDILDLPSPLTKPGIEPASMRSPS